MPTIVHGGSGQLALGWRQVLTSFAQASGQPDMPGPLFSNAEAERRVEAMRDSVREVMQALETLGKGSLWNPDIEVSDDCKNHQPQPPAWRCQPMADARPPALP